ncbi:MAG TPA: hypothetical protein VIL74_12970 [Pyrinomonadaceae bacterium]|jgi:sugar lactone lactonase YvrE/DNA-directed RNA polymerase subunit RPC12/RpoP
MKPLICPQCGGKITDYNQWQKIINCQYCSTRFIVGDEHREPPVSFEPAPDFSGAAKAGQNLVIGIVASICLIFGAIIVVALVANRPHRSVPEYPAYKAPTPFPQKSATPAATPNPNLLEFGGKGTANGLFQNADAIAVDGKGRIYVADDSLRVQQFNEKGEFLNVWQIPQSGKGYKRARAIQKIAVDDQERLYVLVAGVLQMWEQNTVELPEMTWNVDSEYIVDFALRSDGGMLWVSASNDVETLMYMSRSGKVTRRVGGFHTDTADAALSPRETGLAAIRIATDGAGNIFSLYAFGDLGSYQLSYNTEDLVMFRFTPEGKYVDRFVQTMNSCGIAVDNQSRLYISDEDQLKIYTNSGDAVTTVSGFKNIDAFALDKDNNMYVLSDDKVVKRAAIANSND